MKIETIQVSPIGTNCYLLCDDKTGVCAVVDPGGEPERVADAIRDSGLTPTAILLTHGHYDHTGGVTGLQSRFPGLPVYVHAADIPDGPTDRTTAHLFPKLTGDVRTFADGDEIPVGQITVHVVHTPGHTKGSVSLVAEDVIFSGDTLFAGSCGRVDLPGGDALEMLASLKLLGSYKNDYHVLPGHMEATELSCEKTTNPFMLQALRGE